MAIFQKSIVEKYLNTLDESLIENAFDTYRSVYVPKIDRIRNLKEEQYQTQFLQDIFGSILGYTIDPEAGYNIELEKKNESNSKKADGAIVKEDKVLGVIELKSNKTKNLDSIKDQAFGYKNNHKGCNYVISSNFHKLRFYVDDATEYEEFDLYNLDKESFKKFYLFLRKEGLLDKNIPKLLKEETKFHEENISKQLYKDYSSFKNKFFENIVKNNPEVDKLILFKKSQKFLDRILFILFAEDKNLIPANAMPRIVESWALADDLHYKPLYELFKTFFTHLNVGHVYKSGYEIPAYGGGLFMPDEVLDNLKVDDEILKDDLLVLSKYDFNTEVDVNILGHIFEHSLSEIEETEAKLKGEEVEKSKGKRKKDGVFYTPKYITKYIVDNTVGKLCNERKRILELDQDFDIVEYQKSNGGVNKKGEKLFHTLESYKKWLLELKIVDPACGSGAFLNEALSFLINEHKDIDDLIAELTNTPLRIFDTEKSILENNIYGVDINEESVEIAKLSMWLRTAQKGRQLSDLSNNIKCGNSLIDDPEIAGDKAFNWEDEFPQVFTKGGFDVVIGNPPYVRVQSLKENYFSQTEFLEKTYVSATGKYDLYAIFMESSYNLINQFGLVSFILPHKFLVADFGSGIRKFLSKNKAVESILHFGSDIVFNDASTYTCIVNLQKKADELKFVKIKPLNITNSFKFNSIDYSYLSNEAWLLKDKTEISLFDKITKGKSLENMCEGIYQGLITTGDDIFMVEGEIEDKIFRGYSKALASKIELEAGLLKEVLKGQDIKRYLPLRSNRYVIYPHKLNSSNKTVAIEEDNFENVYPKTFNYLLNFKEHLVEKKIRYKTNPKYWYSLHRSREISLFEQDYLITPQLQNYPSFTVKETNVYADAGGYLLLPKKIYNSLELLPILNSKLLWYFIKNTSSEYGGGYFYFKTKYLEPFCIPTQRLDEFDFKDVVSSQLNQTQTLFSEVHKFQRTLQRKFEGLDKLPKKLENWYELTFTDFVKELKKKKIKLSLRDEAEWEDYFLLEQQKAIEIKAQITKTDKKIDAMVYELYGLTDEEIAIIEND